MPVQCTAAITETAPTRAAPAPEPLMMAGETVGLPPWRFGRSSAEPDGELRGGLGVDPDRALEPAERDGADAEHCASPPGHEHLATTDVDRDVRNVAGRGRVERPRQQVTRPGLGVRNAWSGTGLVGRDPRHRHTRLRERPLDDARAVVAALGIGFTTPYVRHSEFGVAGPDSGRDLLGCHRLPAPECRPSVSRAPWSGR